MILVFNPGSTTLKYKLFTTRLKIVEGGGFANLRESDFGDTILKIAKLLQKFQPNIDRVAFRIVAGGSLTDGVKLDKNAIDEITRYSYLAPLHNKITLSCIKESIKIFNGILHLGYFDSSYYKTLPQTEQIYPIDQIIAKRYNIKRNGYHGISHQSAYLSSNAKKSDRVISIHLGSGCSITAIKGGVPVATSMGFTPMEGLIMQSRSGSIDPGVVLLLSREIGVNKTEELLNRFSGLSALTETNGNMLDLLYLAGEKIDDRNYLPSKDIKRNKTNLQSSQFALDIYCNSIKKYIGSMSTILGGVDRVIFTGKIGANSQIIRTRVMRGLEYLKIKQIDIVAPDEELMIAKMVRNASKK